MKAVLQQLNEHYAPVAELQPAVPSPAALIHLPTSVREQIRSVEGLQIPSQQTMIQCKQLCAYTHGTETAVFKNGAYVTDPIRFVNIVTVQSSMIVVGGDCGGGHTQLGITYTTKTKQTFAALLVYSGKDSWEAMYQLVFSPGITPFTGDSVDHPHIFAVLQHFIDHRNAFLNGDWPFINALLGLKNAAATHPCPICIVTSNPKSLLRTARYRESKDNHSKHSDQPPLLTILPERIVPTPLHLFLGISNRIIFDAYGEIFGESMVTAAIQRIRTVHGAGCGGLSDVFDLNGPEIRKWIKHDCCSSLLSSFSYYS